MKQKTIHIENLSIGYLGKTDVKVVADRINADINCGELTCLLGANGWGSLLCCVRFRLFSLNWEAR